MVKLISTPKAVSLLAPETPPTPASSISAAQAHAADLAERATQAAEAAFEETLARIGAPAEYAKAGELREALLPWKPIAEEKLKKMTVPLETRRTILEHRPGLAFAFENLSRWADEVTALAITQIRELQDQRREYEALTAADLLPQPGRDCWLPTPFGLVNSKLWKLRCALGCHRPVADVGVAIERLEASWQELSERLAAPVAVSPQPAPVVAVTPRAADQGPAPTVTHFSPFDYPAR